MRATCACCDRPYDDQWVIYCPVTRELAEQLRGDGLTSKHPVTIRIADDGVITITEHYPELIDGPSPVCMIPACGCNGDAHA